MTTTAKKPEVVLRSTKPPTANEATVLNKFSREVTQSPERGGAQAMLHAVGLSVDDLNKAQVGISSVWWEGNPCNSHLLEVG